MPLGSREGLGNEMFSWGKAYIASVALDLTLLPPAFGPNPRGYWRYFRRSRFDWVVHRGLRAALPKIIFTEAEFQKREELGFTGALQAFAKENGLYRRRPVLLCLEGMWGWISSDQLSTGLSVVPASLGALDAIKSFCARSASAGQ
jgi:hypothetical protein